MNFATAPRSFSRGKRLHIDGAFWAYMGCLAGLVGMPSVPPHRLGLDWQRSFESLGRAFGQHELRRLELSVAREGWAQGPIARRGDWAANDGTPVEDLIADTVERSS